ncbi:MULTISPECIES: aldose 1-epimerase [Flavobacteriaceae]|uniref:aldose 1-epimerase n=1 Tax=Flavobacteriaceae TaxID=49546 RepID=UPI001491B876|nr:MULTISPECIES: aldose 1-epimerase [Allomuricauda]MDC6367323.1 aldose 1-epimerase [Muricauda sp. AC10]
METRENYISGIKTIEVWDENHNLLFTMTPSKGAKILHLNMVKDNKPVPILWKVNVDELENNEFGKNDILFPFPNRLKGGVYQYGGKKYTFPINEIERNNSIHGFIRDHDFTQKNIQVLNDAVNMAFSYTFHGEPYYPFPFNFEVSYHIKNDYFRIAFSIKNTGNGKMPFGLGWHPYFVLKGNEKIKIPGVTEYLVDNNFIPTGNTLDFESKYFVPDNTFYNATFKALDVKKPIYKIFSKDDVIELRCSENFGFLQLYTPPDQQTVAIEPMTCCIDAFNNGIGLMELKPLEVFEGNIEIKLLSR